MKIKRNLKKLVAGLFLAAVVFTSVFTFSSRDAHAETYQTRYGNMIYSDEYATAFVEDGGRKGTICLDTDTVQKVGWTLDNIDGVALKDIIKYDNGYVDRIDMNYASQSTDITWRNYTIRVHGRGPETSSLGLAFQDSEPDTYHLSLYSTTVKCHYVSFNSSNPQITKISWEF